VSKRAYSMSLCLLLCLTALLLAPRFAADAFAYADAAGVPTGDQEKAEIIDSCEDAPRAQGGKMIGYMVPCIAHTVKVSTIEFVAGMVDWLRPLLYTFLTLVVLFFGLRVLQQEPEIHKQGLLLLIKVTLVIAILDDVGSIASMDGAGTGSVLIGSAFDLLDESQEMILGSLNVANTFACNVEDFRGPNTPLVWASMDCLMGKLFGFVAGDSGERPNLLLQTSLIGLVGGFLMGGAWGVTIFFAIMGVLISMFLLIVRTVVTVLNSYFILCIMFVLLPLLLPLIFMRATTAYFDPLWKNILGAFLAPVILCGYTVIALLLYDKMLFANDSMVSRLFDFEVVKTALKPAEKVCDKPVTGDSSLRFDANTSPDMIRNSMAFWGNTVMPTLTGANDLCMGARAYKVNLEDFNAPMFKQGRESYTALFDDLIMLLVLSILINAGTAGTNALIRVLTAGSRSVSAAYQATAGEFDKAVQGGLDRGQAVAKDALQMKDGQGNAYRDAEGKLQASRSGSELTPEQFGSALQAGRGATRESISKSAAEAGNSSVANVLRGMAARRDK
jgi:type IV secretory pathway VirB6-like protein